MSKELETIPNDYACTCGGSDMSPCNGCLMNKAVRPYKIQGAKLEADIEKAKGLLKMCYKELSEKDVEVVKLKAVAERLIKDLNV